jgi:uncharacterized membrane protein
VKKELRPTPTLLPSWLRFLVIVLLLLGLYFRFVNLDRKVYWCDETFTSLRISGYTAEEFVQHVFNRKVIDVESLQKYQRPTPEKSVIDTINSLAVEEPQHSPLYYVLVRFWVQVFGNSVAVTRSLSALISLLTFPCIYWLCLELFESPLTGWMSIAMVSVSSFHFLYAQEAREYTLWIITILLASASLLRAMRQKTKLCWGIYAAALALSLYSFLFSVWMAISHGIYVGLIKGLRLSKTVIAYLFASFIGFILFIPWFWVILNSYQFYTTTDWLHSSLPILDLFNSWGKNISFLFFDVQAFGLPLSSYNEPQNFWHPLTFIILPILGLVGYSIYFICSQTVEQTWLFILTLMASTALPLVLIDLCLGWHLSSIVRYLIPSCLGIQLAVAYLLATKISSISINFRQQKLWLFVTIVLISIGVISGIVSSQSETAWNKGSSYNLQIADIVNQFQANRPLLISYSSAMCDVLSLSHLLSPNVQLLLLPRLPGSELVIPNMDKHFSDIFLFDPHKADFRYELESQHKNKIKIIYEFDTIKVWKL